LDVMIGLNRTIYANRVSQPAFASLGETDYISQGSWREQPGSEQATRPPKF